MTSETTSNPTPAPEQGPGPLPEDWADAGYRPLTPPDPDAAARQDLLRRLGLGEHPDPALDDFAARLAHDAAAITGGGAHPYAMVNIFTGGRQYFAGLHTPTPGDPPGEGPPAPRPPTGRVMPLDHGFCPHVVARRKALPLADVCAWPRFRANPVADSLGVRSYLGAPLIHPGTGIPLGTVCVVDTTPRPWSHPGLALIKQRAHEATQLILTRHP